MNDIITVDKSEIVKLSRIGDKLAIKPEAEEALLRLMDLKDFIDKTLEDVKEQIAIKGVEIYPDFKGIVGDKVKAVYRAYGDKYETDNPEFRKEIISTRVDSKKIDSYVEEVGELPKGVNQKERTTKLILTRNE